jgi:hypothetical protein
LSELSALGREVVENVLANNPRKAIEMLREFGGL